MRIASSVLLIGLCISFDAGHAEDSVSPGVVSAGDESAARASVRAMVITLRSIRSGQCRLKSHQKFFTQRKGVAQTETIDDEWYVAFDKSKDSYRYDYFRSEKSGRPDQRVILPDVVLTAPPDWISKGPGGSTSRPVIRNLRADRKDPFHRCLDPVSLVFSDCFSNRIIANPVGLQDLLFDTEFPNSTVARMEFLEDSLVCVHLQFDRPEAGVRIERRLTMDSIRGYLPVRVEYRYGNIMDEGEMRWRSPDVILTEWTLQNECYVPVRVTTSGDLSVKSEQQYDMIWENVNQEIDPAIFSEAAFDLKRLDALVIAKKDRNSDKQQLVVESVIGVTDTQPPSAVKNNPSNRIRLFAIVITHVVLVWVLWYLFRSRNTKS